MFDFTDVGSLLERLPSPPRVLVVGDPGTGKSTLTEALALKLLASGVQCVGLAADPGQPLFGPPASVTLAVRDNDGWTNRVVVGLGTLDAGRFRLPLVQAVEQAVTWHPHEVLLVDAPGVARGVATAELLPALMTAAKATSAIVLERPGHASTLAAMLRAHGRHVVSVQASSLARCESTMVRVQRRTDRWHEWMRDAGELKLDLAQIPVLGTPPLTDTASWPGRVVVLYDSAGATIGLGQAVRLVGSKLTLRLPQQQIAAGRVAAICVRDARFDELRGVLLTDPGERGTQEQPSHPKRVAFTVRPVPHVPVDFDTTGLNRRAALVPTLVNGLFGDPLLHLRVLYERRSLLVDLGETRELPTRVAHQVTDVCLSHAHIDHVAGMTWLIRMRVGLRESCRIWGPPGTAERVESQVRAFTWNLVGECGPRFDVAEVRGEQLWRFEVQAGRPGPHFVDRTPIHDGLLHQEPTLAIRAATLDHHTPVLAYSIEQAHHYSVRKDRLAARGWPAGPWLGMLKRAVADNQLTETVRVPDGSCWPVHQLAAELLIERAGQRIVYATDIADTPGNRRTLVKLAEGADLFVCEASFLQQDEDRARATAHLTTRACAEVALEAEVHELVPTHFSARYEQCPERVFAEIAAIFPRTRVPASLQLGASQQSVAPATDV